MQLNDIQHAYISSIFNFRVILGRAGPSGPMLQPKITQNLRYTPKNYFVRNIDVKCNRMTCNMHIFILFAIFGSFWAGPGHLAQGTCPKSPKNWSKNSWSPSIVSLTYFELKKTKKSIWALKLHKLSFQDISWRTNTGKSHSQKL